MNVVSVSRSVLLLFTAIGAGAAPGSHDPWDEYKKPPIYAGARFGGRACIGPVAMSQNGRYVAFTSRTRDDLPTNIYRYSVAGGEKVDLVSVRARTTAAPKDALEPSISADGRYITFSSTDVGFAGTDPKPAGGSHVFIRDMETGTTRVVSDARTADPVTSGNSYAAQISADGSSVVFVSDTSKINDAGPVADGKVPAVFEWQADTGTITLVSAGRSGLTAVLPNDRSDLPAVSKDGRFVAFATAASNITTSADTNKSIDIYRWDRNDKSIVLVSVAADGKGANASSGSPSISNDGSRIGFVSKAGNLVGSDQLTDDNGEADFFVRDLMVPYTARVSLAFVETDRDFPGSRKRSRQWTQSEWGVVSGALSGNGNRVAVTANHSLLFVEGKGTFKFDGWNHDIGQHDVFLIDLAPGKPLPTRVWPITVGVAPLGQCDDCDPVWYLPDWNPNGIRLVGGDVTGIQALSDDGSIVVPVSASPALFRRATFTRTWHQTVWWCSQRIEVCQDPTYRGRGNYINYDVVDLPEAPDPPYTDVDGYTGLGGWWSGDWTGIDTESFAVLTIRATLFGSDSQAYIQHYQQLGQWPSAAATGGVTQPVYFIADGVNRV